VQTDHLVVVKGAAKVVYYDDREGSKTKGEVNEYFPGERNPMLIKIPPLVLHRFKAIEGEAAYVVNTRQSCTTTRSRTSIAGLTTHRMSCTSGRWRCAEATGLVHYSRSYWRRMPSGKRRAKRRERTASSPKVMPVL
jgi:hypothetical protein